MISIIDLFDKDNILCPEWLSYESLEDEWLESVYDYDEGIHTWSLDIPMKEAKITFDGVEYNFYAVIDGELHILETITEDHVIQY